ncbi:MAG: prepilin-type N-terminal cleavage/methylation domain-containing protein [Nitrospirota bacterium]|nr:prepilin-type N-terminal cleavage/methylation domain-containing protein [Nitrospirota bacterium]MDH5768035.1 prepilin-type N-terminal cleavage/methylation domain-containing protein [Nitrospirota bacterium]
MKKILVTHYSLLITKKGFTLIEVLVAFALLSIILAALYSTFFISHKAMEGLDESLVKLQECRMSIDTMRRDIDSVLYDPINKNSLFKVEDKDIYGKQTSKLVFTTFSTLRPGLSRIAYFVKEKDKKLVLMKEITSAYTSENVGEGFEVVEDIEAFTVEVNYKDNWVKTWDSALTRTIPQDIRITLTTRLKNKTLTLFEIAKPKRGLTL